MLNSWSQSLSGSPEISSQMLSQFLWFSKYIKIKGTVIYFPKFSNKAVNVLSQLFENGRIISWINVKDICELTINIFFTYAKIITLSKKLEFYLLINYPLRKYIQF